MLTAISNYFYIKYVVSYWFSTRQTDNPNSKVMIVQSLHVYPCCNCEISANSDYLNCYYQIQSFLLNIFISNPLFSKLYCQYICKPK